MNTRHSISHCPLQWKLSLAKSCHDPPLIILLPDWAYGLLPFCGPGLRKDVWRRESLFQSEICSFFNNHDIATLSLEPAIPDTIPSDDEIISATYIPDIFSSIKQITRDNNYLIPRMVLFGHGFGSRLLCDIVTYGVKPAGYIIAGGIYSDTDSIITQKYLPLKNFKSVNQEEGDISSIDPDTTLIMANLGKIFRAIRKGKGRIRLKENGNSLDILISGDLFSEEKSPSILFSALDGPCLILHGSGDLDVPVSNAFFLETKLKQKNSSVSRVVMLDKDHWFRKMPQDSDERLIERISGNFVKNPLDNRFLKNCLLFITDILKIRRRIKANS